jgi:hypothetical protein
MWAQVACEALRSGHVIELRYDGYTRMVEVHAGPGLRGAKVRRTRSEQMPFPVCRRKRPMVDVAGTSHLCH